MADLTLCIGNDKCTLKFACRRFTEDDKKRSNRYSRFDYWNGECNAFYRLETEEERLEAINDDFKEKQREIF